MNDMNNVTERPLTYTSPAILERRRRILQKTREMIEENGIGDFSMSELCRRANVAKRTLYNAFQTRERLIAAAIQEYFLEYLGRISYKHQPGTLQRNMERIVAVGRRNLKIRNYIRAVMEVYFSSDVSVDIWEAMNSVAVSSNFEYIRDLKRRRELQPWIDPEKLANDVVRYEYATIHDWARGILPDEELEPRLVIGYLTIMLGATRGNARTEIEAELKHQMA